MLWKCNNEIINCLQLCRANKPVSSYNWARPLHLMSNVCNIGHITGRFPNPGGHRFRSSNEMLRFPNFPSSKSRGKPSAANLTRPLLNGHGGNHN